MNRAMLIGGVVLMVAGGGGAAQCLVDTQQSCCNVLVGDAPTNRGPCDKDPAGTNCSDIVIGNPVIPYVYAATLGVKSGLNFPASQTCKWQRRYCNAGGFCAVSSIMTNTCTPSEIMGPTQECP